MKVFKTSIQPSAKNINDQLSDQLNDLFQDKIQKDVYLDIDQNGNCIDIGQKDLYDSFLYRFVIEGSDIQMIKGEHYTDDVYSLALEDILNTLIVNYISEKNIEAVQY